MDSIKAIKGMKDIYPEETALWRQVESVFTQLMAQYGYGEIRLPIAEKTALFARSIGAVTDIVEKEMYTFADRNDESLSLRPEGTAGCVRSLIESGNANGRSQHKLWYAGPMFRYEQPQKGRQRQFNQIGVESFGVAEADMDAELLLLTARLWRRLGVADVLQLEVNSIGTSEERATFKAALVEYLSDKFEQLDADSQRRLHTNPLRILDSKSVSTQALLNDAPNLQDFLGDDTTAHFNEVLAHLDANGVSYRVNPRLVRGLDYYNYTVFEWTTDRLGAQSTVCAGGRYDRLVEQLGGKPTPAVGFAMGMERIVLLLQALSLQPEPDNADIYVVSAGEGTRPYAMQLAEALRDSATDLRVLCHLGGGGFKSQMKKVDKSGATIAIIIGDDELAQRQFSVKWLRDRDRPQAVFERDQTDQLIQAYRATV